jgi:4-aminobutyrate aminotransferase-like enzyme/Ser/Thr protein kinase RdoA (MazF antagonist)
MWHDARMSIVEHAPGFAAEDAAALAAALFGVEGHANPLPSERDQNVRIDAPDGRRFVLKIANAREEAAMLEAQNAAMEHAAARGVACQRPLAGRDGLAIHRVDGRDGRRHLVRLLTWLPGTPLAATRPRTDAQRASLGRLMGELDAALAAFDHPAAHRAFHWDPARAAEIVPPLLAGLGDEGRRALVARLLARFERDTLPHLAGLRRGVIHGDANDYNVLVGGADDPLEHNQRIVGLLDFGDMVHGVVAAEPAVAAAYALLGAADPLAAACAVVAGYHAVHPLGEGEIAAAWDLACMRLCLSVCHAADQRRAQPGNDYLSISEAAAWDALERMAAIHPRLAHYALRASCGIEPCPQGGRVAAWLRAHAGSCAPVLDDAVARAGIGTRAGTGTGGAELAREPVHPVDLSIGSPLLTSALLARGDAHAIGAAIAADIAAAGARVGAGGYSEARAIYTGPQFAVDGSPTGERRTVHLGVDVFAPPGTAVHAPLAGTLAAFHDNAAAQDYGPVVLLRHETDDGTPFFTLYGHLSRASLVGKVAGAAVAAGERVGWIGAPPENGDWPPHLHLQVIVDHLDLGLDYPGVAAPSRRRVYLSLSPDPAPLLGSAAPAPRRPARTVEQTLAERRERIGRNLSVSYRRPLKIVRGLGAYLFDDEGRAYLDCVNNVAHVGHCHPRVVAAGARQAAVLNTNTRYLHDSILEYARRLTATLPEPLSVCFFVNSGSEANDLALRLARTATGRDDVIAVDVAYHGHTQALIDVSPYKHDGPGGRGRPPFVQVVPMPDPYRGPHRGGGPGAGRAYAADVGHAIAAINERGGAPAAFIAESLPGCGGQIVFPEGFLADAFARVREAGGVCIADEVQTGFGRVGTHFWAFETQGVAPDIVTMGKPAGNGHPLAVVVTTPAIADAFANGMEYFNTFGGNPVSCEIGLAVLDVIADERLQENARAVGAHLLARLYELADRHQVIGDVRGLGLFLGVELVRDRETRTPAPRVAGYVAERMREAGVLLSTDGPDHNVLKIKPPMVFSRRDADHLADTLAEVLSEDVPSLR